MYKKFSFIGSIICSLAAIFYLYEYALQVSLSVMTGELMTELQLNAAAIGIVSAAYYYAYTPMQIPAGILHDHFGPRRTLTFAVFICSIGAFLFAKSQTAYMASLGRFLMGIGSACSFSGALLLITRWFPPNYFAVLSGTVQLMSAAGAIGGEFFLSMAVQQYGWQYSMFSLGLIGMILSVLMSGIIRNQPTSLVQVSYEKQKFQGFKKNRFKQLFYSGKTFWIGSYSFLIWAAITGFAGLWGIPFLSVAHHLTIKQASFACAMVWIGVGIGSPILGWVSECLQKRSVVLIYCAMIGFISSLVVIYFNLSIFVLYGFLFLLGISASGQSLAFCVIRDISHPDILGTSIGINNMATVASGAVLQPIIGLLLYTNWDGTYLLNRVPHYTLNNYYSALFLIPVCYFFAILISKFCIEETHCKPLYLALTPSDSFS